LDSLENKELLQRIGRRLREESGATLDCGLPAAMQSRLDRLRDAEADCRNSGTASLGGTADPAE
jgi:hypothetical protein